MGGIGGSGNGRYHGYYSFETFSHQRTMATVPSWADSLLRVRYPPYRAKDLREFNMLSLGKPNFDRDGNVNRLTYWFNLIFCLGGKSTSSAVFRWGILLAVALSVGLKRNSLGL